MPFSNLLGNEAIKKWIERAINSNRLPSSMIFAGSRGIGKKTFAIELAKLLNCKNTDFDHYVDNCGKCSVCNRIAQNQFADFKIVSPEGQFIKIDQVREVVEEIGFRPFEGRARVYIFDDAEWLREQAANALLKTLEEPPSGSYIVLVTSSPETLLPTIRSRTIKLNFAPLPENAIKSYLSINHTRPENEMKLLVKLAAGSIGHALSIDLSVYLEQRKECIELLDLVLRRKQKVRLFKAAEYFGRKEKPEFEKFLAAIQLLLRDLVCLKVGALSEMTNIDIVEKLETLAEITEFTQLQILVKSLTEIEKNMQRNINRQLALETLFVC